MRIDVIIAFFNRAFELIEGYECLGFVRDNEIYTMEEIGGVLDEIIEESGEKDEVEVEEIPEWFFWICSNANKFSLYKRSDNVLFYSIGSSYILWN